MLAAQDQDGSAQGRKVEAPALALLSRSATECAAAIRKGETSSVALLKACLAQLDAVNPLLNACVADRRKEALLEAEACDAAVASGTAPAPASAQGALWGVPIIVKECFEVSGLPNTAGVLARKDVVAAKDAPAVAALKQAGLVIVGVGNTSEACMWFESDNPLYGKSRNPFNLHRTPGGSSGGCAALVASRVCAVAVTSDVGGSTRIPAAYCGLFGLKPTGGTVSNQGTFPSCGTGDLNRLCQLGPSATHAVDLLPLLRILATSPSAPAAPTSSSASSPPHRVLGVHVDPVTAVDMSTLKVFDVWEPCGAALLTSRQHPSLVLAQRRAANALRDLGCRVERCTAFQHTLAPGANAFSIWSAMMDLAKPEPFLTTITKCDAPENGDDLSQAPSAWRLLFQAIGDALRLPPTRAHSSKTAAPAGFGGGVGPAHTVPAAALAALESVAALFPARARKLAQEGKALSEEVDALLGDHGVLLMPALPHLAPRHGGGLLRVLDTANTSVWNALGQPCVHVPLGLSHNHLGNSGGGGSTALPVGVQVVAAKGCDHLCVAVALALERAGVAVSPPPF